MFTGIIEEIGKVSGIDKTQRGSSLKVASCEVSKDVRLGDSIAVNGICLSVSDIKNNILGFDVMQETLKNTTIGGLKISDPLNLERSLKPDSRIGGHFVSGHIDYKGRIDEVLKGTEGNGFRISLPFEFSRLVAKKGSIAVDGVSLTVAGLTRESFIVYLIPHTLKNTTLGKRKKGDSLNIETDLLAKYLSRHTRRPDLQDLLKKYDYI
jgi:riboflavin synthase